MCTELFIYVICNSLFVCLFFSHSCHLCHPVFTAQRTHDNENTSSRSPRVTIIISSQWVSHELSSCCTGFTNSSATLYSKSLSEQLVLMHRQQFSNRLQINSFSSLPLYDSSNHNYFVYLKYAWYSSIFFSYRSGLN